MKEQEAEMAMQRWLEDVGDNLELVVEEYGVEIVKHISSKVLSNELRGRGYKVEGLFSSKTH
jgi:hypothetical protein